VLGAFPTRICNASRCSYSTSKSSAISPSRLRGSRGTRTSGRTICPMCLRPPPPLSQLPSVGGVVRLPRLAVGPLTLSIGSQQLTIVSPSERPIRGDSAPGPSIPEPNGRTPFPSPGGKRKIGCFPQSTSWVALGAALAHLQACGASATLICSEAPWASWWPSLRHGPVWARDVTSVVPLGRPGEILAISSRDRRLFGNGPVIEVRFGSSRRSVPR
jgi:hypothetical protein